MALAPSGTSTSATPGNPNGAAVDVVAVLDTDSGQQKFAKARPMRATVFERSELMEHPLEDGSVINDHKVAKPTEIDLPLFLSNSQELPEVFEEIRQLYNDGTLLLVQTRTATYSNMVIMELPHEETGDTLGSVALGLRLKQARFITAKQGVAPKAAKHKKTAKRGTQQTTKATPPQEKKASDTAKGSTLYRLFHKGK